MILPAIRDLNLCRKLEVSWRELQDMPEEMIELWDAILTGEAEGAKMRKG